MPCASLRAALSDQATGRGHKTDTPETTRATPREHSEPFKTARFAGEPCSRMTAHDAPKFHGKEAVDGSSPSEGSLSE
jgi:hypothetical protein